MDKQKLQYELKKLGEETIRKSNEIFKKYSAIDTPGLDNPDEQKEMHDVIEHFNKMMKAIKEKYGG